MNIEVEITRQEYLRVMRFLAREECGLEGASRPWGEAMVTAIFWVPVGMALTAGFSAGIGTGGIVAASIGSLVALPAVLKKLRLRAWTKLPPLPRSQYGPKVYSATDHGLLVEWEGGRSEVAWGSIDRMVERDGMLLLIVDKVSAYIIPDRAFASAEDRASFVALVNSKRPQSGGSVTASGG